LYDSSVIVPTHGPEGVLIVTPAIEIAGGVRHVVTLPSILYVSSIPNTVEWSFQNAGLPSDPEANVTLGSLISLPMDIEMSGPPGNVPV
jgi:hypothetical protein